MNKSTIKYLALTAGLTLVVVGVQFLIIEPMNAQEQTILATISESNSQLDDYQQTMYSINDYFERKRELISQRDVLTARLYNKEEVLSLIEQLKTDAQQLSLIVKEITPSLSELLELNTLAPNEETPRYLDISMRFTGSIGNSGEFLFALEQEPMFVRLISYNVIARESGKAPAEFRVKFSTIIGGLVAQPSGN